jgi:ankyrin repeat protein
MNRCHDNEGIKLLLASGGDIDAQDRDGVTPLLAAIRYGAPISHIKYLIQLHANCNIADNNNITPLIELMYSSRYHTTANINTAISHVHGHDDGVSTFQSLLQCMYDRGVRVDIADNIGRTPLFGAIHTLRSSSIVASLLHNGGASPNYRTHITAIKLSLTPSSSAVPVLVSSSGASTGSALSSSGISDNKSNDTFHMAATAWTHAFATLPLVADMLPSTSSFHPPHPPPPPSNIMTGMRTALHITDDIDIVRLLLRAGGDPSLRDNAGYLPADYRSHGEIFSMHI